MLLACGTEAVARLPLGVSSLPRVRLESANRGQPWGHLGLRCHVCSHQNELLGLGAEEAGSIAMCVLMLPRSNITGKASGKAQIPPILRHGRGLGTPGS